MKFWTIVAAIIIGLFLARLLPYVALLLAGLGIIGACIVSLVTGWLSGSLKITRKK